MVSLDLGAIINEIETAQGVWKPDPSIEKAAQRNATNTYAGEQNAFSLTPDYLSFRNTWWGQPQPVSYKALWKAFLEDPVVRACVDITVDAIIGDGYSIRGKTELHVKRIKNVFRENRFQKFLQDMVSSLVIYGDSYSELIRGEGGLVKYFRPVDSATVRIDYDEHGDTVKYIQRVLHRRVDFYLDEMLHFSISNVGGRVYGLSWMQSILFTLQAKMAAQNFNTEYFRRPGLPRSLYFVKNLSNDQVKRMATTLQSATPQTDIMINAAAGDITYQSVAPSNADMQFIELMQFLRQEIIAASGVPPIFLGITEGSNRSNAQTQMESWDRKKNKMRLMLADIVNTSLLTTANFGFDDVMFKFNDENSRERLKYIQMAQLASGIKWFTPNQVLKISGLPDMEDSEVIYDSVMGDIDKKTDSVGDTPIYLLEQEMAQQKAEQDMAMASGQKPGGKPDNKNPNAANPMRNQDKADNARRLNSAQGNETRKMEKADPSKDYPYGAVEPERELVNPQMKRDFRARMQAIAEAHLRQLRGINYEYDGTTPKDEKKAKDHKLPELTHQHKDAKLEGKAVFFKGVTQLDKLSPEDEAITT